jgi:hypothetical protein
MYKNEGPRFNSPSKRNHANGPRFILEIQKGDGREDKFVHDKVEICRTSE